MDKVKQKEMKKKNNKEKTLLEPNERKDLTKLCAPCLALLAAKMWPELAELLPFQNASLLLERRSWQTEIDI